MLFKSSCLAITNSALENMSRFYFVPFFRFTCMQAYKNLLNELGDQAGQHELIAENLSSSVVQELSTLTKQLKDDRRKVIIESEASFKLTLEKF